jgi:hypothetical protein
MGSEGSSSEVIIAGYHLARPGNRRERRIVANREPEIVNAD